MIFRISVVILAITVASAQELCGVKEADDDKTCISVRLPWQEDPIYFCTEKDNLKYKNRCHDRMARYCPTPATSKSLQVATPWDCCALTSTPDYCADRVCPAAPYNRTCTEITPESHRPWDCCPSYFCEKGSPTTCQMKRLQPGCLSPPKDKSNCTVFRDEHGCCNKYQCANEGKSGMCPMEAQALNFRRMVENRTSSTNNTFNHQFSRPRSFLGVIKTDMRCTGDYTCPGQMKCCSTSISTYYDFQNEKADNKMIGQSGTGSRNKRRDQAIFGYCMEPVTAEEVQIITAS